MNPLSQRSCVHTLSSINGTSGHIAAIKDKHDPEYSLSAAVLMKRYLTQRFEVNFCNCHTAVHTIMLCPLVHKHSLVHEEFPSLYKINYDNYHLSQQSVIYERTFLFANKVECNEFVIYTHVIFLNGDGTRGKY